MPVIQVRDANSDDLPALLRLLRFIYSDEDPGPPRTPLPIEAEAWKRIEAQEGRTLLVAELQGRVVGTVDLLIVPNLTHDAAPYAVIENGAVEPALRRSGVARCVMEEVLRRARAAGCYKVQLMSNHGNTAAHEACRSFGFESSAEGFRRYLTA